MDIKSDNTFCIGQTFNTWEEFQAVFDEHCKTANAKYRLADCKYSSTANRKIPEGSEGLFNEAHRYAYAKFTCALTPHVKQKRVPENEEENENRLESIVLSYSFVKNKIIARSDLLKLSLPQWQFLLQCVFQNNKEFPLSAFEYQLKFIYIIIYSQLLQNPQPTF